MLARCVKASVRYNAYGEFNQSPDNRRRGRHPANMRRDILAAAKLLAGRTVLTCQDYRDTLANVTVADLVYMGPPYQGVSTKRDVRYARQVQYDEFVKALENLVERSISFLVSYDGRRGERIYGNGLPTYLDLQWIEVKVGRSAQSTLLGGRDITFESLYLSPALTKRLKPDQSDSFRVPLLKSQQLDLPTDVTHLRSGELIRSTWLSHGFSNPARCA